MKKSGKESYAAKIWSKYISPITPILPDLTKSLRLEPLEARLLLSVLDFADQQVVEVEPNDVTPGQTIDYNDGTLAVGIDGVLSDGSDVDAYSLAVGQGGEINLMMEITDSGNQDITAVAAGPDDQVYFVANNSVWKQNPVGTTPAAELWASRDDIAEVLDLSGSQLIISDLAVGADGDALLTLEGRGDVVAVDSGSDHEISVLVEEDDIIAVTHASVALVSIDVDSRGNIYVADEHGGSVLYLSPEEGNPDNYQVSEYAGSDDISAALRGDIFDDILSGATPSPLEVIAEADGTFHPDALISGGGAYGREGYDVYYATQLGPTYGGDGSIEKITVNPDDSQDVTFSAFFTPDADQEDVNPSALALDTGGDFGGLMFMGSFGADLGDAQDGKLYTVDSNGQVSEFAINYFSDPINGEVYTGFYDITDMAFSYGGAFGTYLYVLSENIDSNGSEEGGHSSDIWRVSPDGTAELFVSGVADGAITLAFSNDADLGYGGDMYVGTFVDGGKIYKIDSNGGKSLFFDFSDFGGGSLAISDIAFAPYISGLDSVMEGQMVVTLKSASTTYLFQLDSNPQAGVLPDAWARGLDSGDVSNGDIAFNENGALVIGLGGANNLTRVEYEGLFDYSFADLRVRETTEDSDGEQNTTVVPYVSVAVADQPRILGLGVEGEGNDIATEVTPDYLDLGTVPEDGSKDISYIFDASGDIYIYIKNAGVLIKGSRQEIQQSDGTITGRFGQFSQILGSSQISDDTALIDARVSHLAWAADGSLYALGQNGTEPEEGGTVPSQQFDDTILYLGNTGNGQYEAQGMAQVNELAPLQVTISGPDTSWSRQVTPESLPDKPWQLDEVLDNLQAGTYTITVTGMTATSANYELLISLGGEIEYTYVVSEANSPLTLKNSDQQQLVFTYEGKGQASLTVHQKPTGRVVDLITLALADSKSNTVIQLRDVSLSGAWSLDEIILDGSLGSLTFPGAVTTISATTGSKGRIDNLVLGDLANVGSLGTDDTVDPVKYRFVNVDVDELGDAAVDNRVFRAKSLKNLLVRSDMQNITLLDSASDNYFHELTVEGIINNSVIYGDAIDRLLVRNGQKEDAAISASTIDLDDSKGYLNQFQVETGSVVESNFYAGKWIGRFEISDGNMQDSILSASARHALVDYIQVMRQDGTSLENAGNMENSQIVTAGKIKSLYIEGYVADDSNIRASGYNSSRLLEIITGGDMAGTVYASKIRDVLIGFDRDRNRLDEDALPGEAGYSGAYLTGSVKAVSGIRMVNVTGEIDQASISTEMGTIGSIYAEDGFNAALSAGNKVQRIYVGYLNGKLGKIENRHADVSGSITARSMKALYYTGDLDETLQQQLEDRDYVRRLGVVKDVISSIMVDSPVVLEGDGGTTAMVFTMSLSSPARSKFTVNWATADGTATVADNDYEAASGTVLFKRGETSHTFSVVINGDTVLEQSETILINLSTDTDKADLKDDQATGTIYGDDGNNAPAISINDVSLNEGNSGSRTFEFDVSLSQVTALEVSVNYGTEDNTARVADGDYLGHSGVLIFPAGGDLHQSIAITVLGDGISEPDESFFVNLSGAINATIVDAQGIGTILNDD